MNTESKSAAVKEAKKLIRKFRGNDEKVEMKLSEKFSSMTKGEFSGILNAGYDSIMGDRT
jgi:hypothetical protein